MGLNVKTRLTLTSLVTYTLIEIFTLNTLFFVVRLVFIRSQSRAELELDAISVIGFMGNDGILFTH